MKKFWQLTIIIFSFLLLLLVAVVIVFAVSPHVFDLNFSLKMKPNFFYNRFAQIKIVNNQQEKVIQQSIYNHNFSQQLVGWDYIGEVAVEDQILNIGDEHSSNLLNENCIYQQLFFPENLGFLALQYKSNSTQELIGFDLIDWIVLIDEIIYFTHNSQHTSENWQWQLIPLRNIKSGWYQLKICAGNSGDRSQAQIIQFNQVTSFVAAVNNNDQLIFESKDEGNLQTTYFQDGQEFSNEAGQQQVLQFNQDIDNNQIQVKSIVENQEQSSINLPIFYFDDTPQPINNLKIYSLDSNQYLLTFTDLNSQQSFYEIKTHINSFDEPSYWLETEEVQIFFTSNSFKNLRPICVNQQCMLQISTQQDFNFVGIKTCNAANICSSITQTQLP